MVRPGSIPCLGVCPRVLFFRISGGFYDCGWGFERLRDERVALAAYEWWSFPLVVRRVLALRSCGVGWKAG